MRRFLTFVLLGAVALGVSGVAYANVCSFDPVPAATLLFPFVPYEYDGGFDGQTTIFTITNTSSDAQIVHITIWTDYSVAILDYNVVLTGYDVVRQNIRDILQDGILPGPLTGDTQWMDESDLNDAGIGAGTPPVPLGPYSPGNQLYTDEFGSPVVINNIDVPEATRIVDGPAANLQNHQWDLNCNPDWENGGWLGSPNNYTFPIDTATLNYFRGFFTASLNADKGYYCGDVDNDVSDLVGDTWFTMRDSGPAWVYITADVVGTCNKDFPDTTLSYWTPYEEGDTTIGTMKYDNVITGDVIWLSGSGDTRFSEADNAVHIEAVDPRVGALGTIQTAIPNAGAGPNPSQVSFYHRYTLYDADGTLTQANSDGREPLPTAWAFRYQYDPAAGVDTYIRAWKGSSVNRIVPDLDPDLVPGVPPEYINASSCQAYTYYSWDEAENVAAGVVGGGQPPWSGSEVPPVPVPNLLPLETQEVAIDNFAIVEDEETGTAFGWMLFVWPPSNGSTADIYQTWMGVKYVGFTDYSAALTGTVMANYGCDATQVLPDLGWGN